MQGLVIAGVGTPTVVGTCVRIDESVAEGRMIQDWLLIERLRPVRSDLNDALRYSGFSELLRPRGNGKRSEHDQDAPTPPACRPGPRSADRQRAVLTVLASTGPIEVALARSTDAVPPRGSLPGGCVYELKWDGFRGVLRRTKDSVELWSRRGVDLGWRFPDVVAAAITQVPVGTVLDGELCVWLEGRLDWGQLQRRLGSARQIAEQARTSPASYVAFDLLSVDGLDVRTRPWTARRSLLEQFGVDWQPPLQMTPVTFDRDEAEHWSRDYRPVGIEGLVIKGAATRYVPGRASSWLKWKARETEEVILGAVTGTFDRPEAVIAGRL